MNQGRNIHFGVREQAMAAMVNGMALHGGLIPFGATFFTFSDYMRPSLRLAALMGAHRIFILTHHSIGLGQDGPTHQPIEHLTSHGKAGIHRRERCPPRAAAFTSGKRFVHSRAA